MVNHLKINEKKHIISLHSAGLSNREIEIKTGRSKKPNLFVMTLLQILEQTLSCSRHMYQEVIWRQDIKTFIQCQKNGFNYFGGVTEVV